MQQTAPPAPPAPPDEYLGRQTPTHELIAPYAFSEGPYAIEFASTIGMTLDPWQEYVLREGMGVMPNGLWSAFELELICSRRNGKSVIYEARSLYGLFVLRERKIVWSTHRSDTAMESFQRVAAIIEGSPLLKKEIAHRGIRTGNGKESITLKTGQQMVFKTRIDGGGRGLDGDLLIVDEDQDAKESHMASLMPVLAARPNPTIWYAGSAGGPNSAVKGALIHRALDKDVEPEARERLTLFGWSADEDDDPSQVDTWAKANPGLGKRLLVDTMAGFWRANRYTPENFAAEHLGIGNYPRPDGEEWVIPAPDWNRIEDPDSQPVGRLVLAADAKPDQSWSSVSIAGYRADGAVHLELIDHERGTRWVPTRLAQLRQEHDVEPKVIIDPKGPIGYLVPDLEALGIEVHLLEATDVADACSWLVSTATEQPPEVDEAATDDVRARQEAVRAAFRPGVRHRGQTILTAALASAKLRKLLDRFAFSRQGASDISPLTSAAFAGHGLALLGRAAPPPASPQKASRPGGDRARRSGGPDIRTMGF